MENVQWKERMKKDICYDIRLRIDSTLAEAIEKTENFRFQFIFLEMF